jgi:ABC-type nickel/cobalt efflux system permease component RcnA
MLIVAVTAVLAGLVHVLTGPDHLAAIAPLAVNRPTRAWLPGVRWGFGHSAGVAVVGLLSLWLRELIPVQLVSEWGERFVGVMLFGIGLWAWRKVARLDIHTHEHEHNDEKHLHIHLHHHAHGPEGGVHKHGHAAFGIGTLHGLAGSSHFLGVLPMLALPNTTQAVVYLLGFAAGTVAAMGGFSWGIGFVAVRCSGRGMRNYRRLMSGCALAAMVVGGFWLVTGFR